MRPLAIIIRSSSAAGKTALMDGILRFIPKEEREKYSAVSGHALFYFEGKDFKHKILAIVEDEGASNATYPLKLLQSEGEVTIASTGKDAATGKLVTKEYRVEGPVMIFMASTAAEIDEELLNRCLVLTVDESREQTRKIHDLQRAAQSLDGLFLDEEREEIYACHHDAQRLLRPLPVINPYVKELTFLDEKTRTRRDHEKYLGLIKASALLHQYQREIRSLTRFGKTKDYVEASLFDIALANRLASEILGRSLDELPPQTRRLLLLVDEMVSGLSAKHGVDRQDLRFSRRDVRLFTGWGDTQLKIHLSRLAELEYLLQHRAARGQGFVYELLYDGQGKTGEPFLIGLADVRKLARDRGLSAEELRRVDEMESYLDRLFPRICNYDPPRSGFFEERSGAGRPMVGPWSGGGRTHPTVLRPAAGAVSGDSAPETTQNAHLDEAPGREAYVQPPRFNLLRFPPVVLKRRAVAGA